jgi:hypothetical protein
VIEQRLPCRHGDDRNRGRFDVRERHWLAGDHRRPSHGILGVGPDEVRIRHAIDLISNGELGDTWPDCSDLTGQVRARRERQRRRVSALPGPDPGIPQTDAGGVNLDQTSSGAGSGRAIRSSTIAPGGPNSCTRHALIVDRTLGP